MNENQIINMAASQYAANQEGASQTDTTKKKRVELLSYVKAHLDVIAIGLTITYLSYSIWKLNKQK